MNEQDVWFLHKFIWNIIFHSHMKYMESHVKKSWRDQPNVKETIRDLFLKMSNKLLKQINE